jgi:DHA3 family macrolide efflux protein-like MFS transporter
MNDFMIAHLLHNNNKRYCEKCIMGTDDKPHATMRGYINMNLHWKRQITIFLSGQTISMFGTAIVQYAMMWHITLETQSGLFMTLFVLCGFLPTFLLSPFAGVWADRYSRKRLIWLSDSTIAVCTLGLSIIFLLGYHSLWLLLAVAAVRALGTAVQMPAAMAIIPQMVPKEELTRINGIQGTLQSLNFFAAPVVAGLLLAWLPIGGILLIDVATAVIGVFTLALFVKVRPHETEPSEGTGYFHEIRSGLQYVRRHAFLFSLFIYISLLLFVIAAPTFLTPIQVARTFGADVWRLTAVELAFSLGMIAGGSLMAWWGGFRNRIHTFIVAVLMFGVFLIALGLTPIFWLYLMWMLLVGVALPMFNTVVTALLQEKVEEHMLGRVFSLNTMLNSAMLPLGMLMLGPLADLVSVELLMVLCGILVLIQVLVMWRNQSFREAGN